jgi:hypothetical protein
MFKATVKGFNNVSRQFASFARDLPAICDQELQQAAKDWVAGAKRDAPADQGALIQSINYRKVAVMQYNIAAQVFYAPFMEFGTKGKYQPIPGTESIAAQFKGMKGGDFMTLLRMIVRWVKRKGITGTYSVKTRRRTGNRINQLAEDYAAAWPIAMSILKNGISPHPYFFRQQHTVWPQMIRRIEQRLAARSKVSVTMPPGLSNPRIVTI